MASAQQDDVQVVDQVVDRAGSGLQVESLFARYAPALHRYCATRVGPAVADDIVSETFVRALRHGHTYDPSRGTAQAWLFGIASNLLGHHRRAEARYLAAVARDAGRRSAPAVPGESVEARIDASEQIRRLVPALLKLSVADRNILLLNAWVGLEPMEIAAALNMSASTVRSRLHRIRTRLRRAAADADTTRSITTPRSTS